MKKRRKPPPLSMLRSHTLSRPLSLSSTMMWLSLRRKRRFMPQLKLLPSKRSMRRSSTAVRKKRRRRKKRRGSMWREEEEETEEEDTGEAEATEVEEEATIDHLARMLKDSLLLRMSKNTQEAGAEGEEESTEATTEVTTEEAEVIEATEETEEAVTEVIEETEDHEATDHTLKVVTSLKVSQSRETLLPSELISCADD